MFDKIGNARKILSNQTKFPLCTFATAPSIHHISDCDHRICKNTEQFLSPASNPPVPPDHHVVSNLSAFHPQEIESLTSLSFTKSCCQKRKSFIGCDLWEEREKGLISREGERRQRKGRESWSFCCPGADGERQVPWCLLPFPIPGGHIPPHHHHPGLSHGVNHMGACGGRQTVGLKVPISPFLNG